jgi:iron complex outermembrane receptor protein
MLKNFACGKRAGAAVVTSASALTLFSGPVLAQPARQQSSYAPEEIIVTARKRDESIMKAPVVMSAISAQQVQNLKIANFQDMAQVTPGIQIAPAFGTVGMYVYFRGLGNGGGANFADQAVQLNVDGVGYTHGAYYRAGMFDVGQIEVLKGPQALFFGRSASAGIISVNSADPTPEWRTKMTVGYEFNADEMDLDGYVSGPITDKLSIRLAGYHNTYKGWLQNPDPTGTGRVPNGHDSGGRVKLKYDDPDIGLRIKLAYTKARTDTNMWSGDSGQRVCSGAGAQDAAYAYDNCKLDKFTQGSPRPPRYVADPTWLSLASFGNTALFNAGVPDPLFNRGNSYTYTDTDQFVLNIDYDIMPGLTLTSVTGSSHLDTVDAGSAYTGFGPGFFPIFYLAGRYSQQDYSEELRLTSNWKDSWINFLIGGFYNPNQAKNHSWVDFPAFTGDFLTNTKINTKATSAFGQVILTPIEHFELAAGVRYTEIKKNIAVLSYQNNGFQLTGAAPFDGNIVGRVPDSVVKHNEKNTSPEVTLTWRPNDDITAFASYKKGYKAPAVNVNQFAGNYVPGQVGFANGEKVEGWEGGVKAALLDNSLHLTAAAYTYAYNNLQVVFYLGGSFTTTVANGANARVKGFEFSGDYTVPGIDGLTFNAALNYNDSKYTSYAGAPCYGGQQFVDPTGCTSSGGPFTTDLAGKGLAHAPHWTGQFGWNYRHDLTQKYGVAWTFNGNFSSSYNAVDTLNPFGIQKGYVTLDTAVRFGELDGPWEAALIVRNLTDKSYMTAGSDDAVSFNGRPADALVYINRSRQIMLQLTVRPEL